MFTKWKNKKLGDEIQKKCSLQDLFGFQDIKQGVIINKNSYYIPIEILPVNFSLKSNRERAHIIRTYELLLKQMQVPFMIHTFAKPANTREHTEYMKEHYETEQNEVVREMQLEYMEHTSMISRKSAMQKQFIVFIEYPVLPGMQFESIEFQEASHWLHEKRQRFADGIRNCGNSVVIPTYLDDDVCTAQIVYAMLNGKSSEQIRMVKLCD